MVRLAAIAAFLAGSAWMAQAGEAQNSEALKRLVHHDCGSCHGLTLKGGLGPDLRPQTLEHYEVDGLAAVILDGIPGTAMPPWRPLITSDTANWIAQYLLKPETK